MFGVILSGLLAQNQDLTLDESLIIQSWTGVLIRENTFFFNCIAYGKIVFVIDERSTNSMY